uniref:Uncharacterized protein n=1 Tax=Tanacetum cinerariifolium TaxID=118510 RepID=A0A6L2MSU5_TANCI|nr:hypothetical protein [Tanacetum cinerariifolium]
MDWYTKNALWVYWMRCDDEVVLSNKEDLDLNDENNNDERKIVEVFRIKDNLFDYETLLCAKFNEFNYLLKVDLELFTHDIQRTETYEDYENKLNNEFDESWSEDGVPYEMCDHVCETFCFKDGKLSGPPTIRMKMDSVMVESYRECLKEEALKQKAIYEKSWGDASQSVINLCIWLKTCFDNFHELDYELLVKLQDYWWKVNNHERSPFTNWRDHIRGPYTHYYSNVQNEEEQKNSERCELINDREPSIFKIRRSEMINYSFGQEEEYVAIKKNDYDDLTRTNDDACHAYQENFRKMDEGFYISYISFVLYNNTHTHHLPPHRRPAAGHHHHHRRRRKTFLASFSGEPQKYSSHPDLQDLPHHSSPRATHHLRPYSSVVATLHATTTTSAVTPPLLPTPHHAISTPWQPPSPLSPSTASCLHHISTTDTTATSPPPPSPRHPQPPVQGLRKKYHLYLKSEMPP